MASMRRYDEDLRAIGQALEARDISVFDLKRLAELVPGSNAGGGDVGSRSKRKLMANFKKGWTISKKRNRGLNRRSL
jgi:hypothetical protein